MRNGVQYGKYLILIIMIPLILVAGCEFGEQKSHDVVNSDPILSKTNNSDTYKTIPDMEYCVLTEERFEAHDKANPDTSILVRQYQCFDGKENVVYFHTDNVTIDKVNTLYELKQQLIQSDHPDSLRLRPNTIVSNRVLKQWAKENYHPVYEYSKESPKGLTYKTLVKTTKSNSLEPPIENINGDIYTNKDKIPKDNEVLCGKPIIYLYPLHKQRVSVTLDFKGQLVCTYPDYQNGWDVLASPDGTLTNLQDNRQYAYLFWEGTSGAANWDLSKGFVVAGRDTKSFLQEKLASLGLSPKEYNEFIVYWLPVMQDNQYNLISFAGKEYEELAPLQITPKPDSVLRVFMVFKPLDNKIEVQPQELKSFERKGFTVVEWGGTELK